MAPEINVTMTGEDDSMAETTANLPEHKGTFGPVESADETRQAQQQVANDAPADVNVNAVVARSQVLTTDVLGKNFEANADRRNKIADAYMGKSLDKAAT